MYPRSSRPARPTTMFRPIAVAAKMITWVAIDMFASEPSCVNGNRNATTNAARISTLRCRCETRRQPAHRPRPGTARATTAPTNDQEEHERAAVLDVRARTPRRTAPAAISDGDRRGSRAQPGSSPRRRSRGSSASGSMRPTTGEQQRADQGDPAAGVDVDQAAELDGDRDHGPAPCRPAQPVPTALAPARPSAGPAGRLERRARRPAASTEREQRAATSARICSGAGIEV